MRVSEALKIFEELVPLNLTEKYDAVNGLQIEGADVDVKCILTCLDVTPTTVKMAIERGCQIVISHHQPIIIPSRTVLKSDWYGEIVSLALKHDITIYSIHTAYDSVKGGLNDYVGKLIGLENMHPLQHHNGDQSSPHGMGRIGVLKKTLSLNDFAKQVKEKLSASTLKIVGDGKKPIQKVAIGTGNGLALIDDVLKSDVDVYVTGDVQYRDIRKMVQNKMAMIAIEHDDTEKFFSKSIREKLERRLPYLQFVEFNDKFYHVLN